MLVEAGSVGLPVIASGVGGIPELLGEDRGTILSGVSVEAVAAALRWFLAHGPEAELAAQALRTHVHTEYDVNTNARRLLAHYRSAGGRDSDVT